MNIWQQSINNNDHFLGNLFFFNENIQCLNEWFSKYELSNKGGCLEKIIYLYTKISRLFHVKISFILNFK